MESNKKVVTVTFEVPDNGYCWDGRQACQFFDNYRGSGGECEINSVIQHSFIGRYENGKVSMPKFCKEGGKG